MNLRFLNFLYYGSFILVGVAIILAILSETNTYSLAGSVNTMSLVYTSVVLLFIVWQLRRNEMRK